MTVQKRIEPAYVSIEILIMIIPKLSEVLHLPNSAHQLRISLKKTSNSFVIPPQQGDLGRLSRGSSRSRLFKKILWSHQGSSTSAFLVRLPLHPLSFRDLPQERSLHRTCRIGRSRLAFQIGRTRRAIPSRCT